MECVVTRMFKEFKREQERDYGVFYFQNSVLLEDIQLKESSVTNSKEPTNLEVGSLKEKDKVLEELRNKLNL